MTILVFCAHLQLNSHMSMTMQHTHHGQPECPSDTNLILWGKRKVQFKKTGPEYLLFFNLRVSTNNHRGISASTEIHKPSSANAG